MENFHFQNNILLKSSVKKTINSQLDTCRGNGFLEGAEGGACGIHAFCKIEVMEKMQKLMPNSISQVSKNMSTLILSQGELIVY